jgi:SOS-response transcriptional repressor LexA
MRLKKLGEPHPPRRATTQQREVLRFIVAQIREHGVPPSLAEISAHVGYQSKRERARQQVEALVEKGLLEKRPHRARALKPTAWGYAELDLPAAE